MRPVWAEVDLDALRRNAARLAEHSEPAALCAVVKANGYGHGAVAVARAALAGGAAWLAVALVEEGVELRDAGIDAPVLLLSEPPADDMDEVVARSLVPTLYSDEGVEAAAKAAAGHGVGLAVHLKVDTGMHRVGVDPGRAAQLAESVSGRAELRVDGLWTHLAVADEPDNPFTAEQLARFAGVVDDLRARGLCPALLHAANSAAALVHPPARLGLVRCGVALYGLAPSPALAGVLPLEPVLSLKARVSHVQQLGAGEGVSYGLRYRAERPVTLATVPIGYADGVPRRLAATGGEVLVGGRRRPLAGTITMDQLMVDCGDDRGVSAGDEVVLIGRQGPGRIGAEEWAERLDTISYEIVCGVGARVPRVHLGSG